MSLLVPGTTHIVSWTRQNLLDEATYYPLAIIRDTRTDATLDTFALDDLGSGARFARAWNIPPDGSGLGREIEVEITIYEDAGHTQVSGIYGRWAERYLIFDIPGMRNGFGGPGSAVDYKYIEELIRKLLAESLKDIPKKETDLSGMQTEIGGVKSTFGQVLEKLGIFVEKAEEVSETEENVKEESAKLIAAMNKLSDALANVKTNVSEATAEASKRITTAIADAVVKAVQLLNAREGKLAEKTDEELTHIVASIKKIMEDAAIQLSEKASEHITKKPWRIQSFRDHDIVPGDEKESSGSSKSDSRVGNMLRFIGGKR